MPSEAKEARYDEEKPSAKDFKDDDDFDESDNIVTKVMKYFFENQEFNQTFQDFAERECEIFDTEEDEEMKLEYTQVFNKFTALFEEKLEDYIASERSTVKEFYKIVQKAYEKDPESTLAVYSQMLVAVCDFSVFVLMMRRTRDTVMLKSSRK